MTEAAITRCESPDCKRAASWRCAGPCQRALCRLHRYFEPPLTPQFHARPTDTCETCVQEAYARAKRRDPDRFAGMQRPPTDEEIAEATRADAIKDEWLAAILAELTTVLDPVEQLIRAATCCSVTIGTSLQRKWYPGRLDEFFPEYRASGPPVPGRYPWVTEDIAAWFLDNVTVPPNSTSRLVYRERRRLRPPGWVEEDVPAWEFREGSAYSTHLGEHGGSVDVGITQEGRVYYGTSQDLPHERQEGFNLRALHDMGLLLRYPLYPPPPIRPARPLVESEPPIYKIANWE
jgi:hypothetical protein